MEKLLPEFIKDIELVQLLPWNIKTQSFMKKIFFLQLFLCFFQVLYAIEPSGRGCDWDDGFLNWYHNSPTGKEGLYGLILLAIILTVILFRNIKEKIKTAREKNKGKSSPSAGVGGSKNSYFQHFIVKKKIEPTKYVAVLIDMLIVFIIGFWIYTNNDILYNDKILFLSVCVFLAIVDWLYPFFETCVNIDNDGCMEQGCLHPIIGLFGLLLSPLVIHYWLYKGISYLIGLIKK